MFRKFLPTLVAAFLCCVSILAFAQGVPNRQIWKAGEMSVTVIQDLPGEMQSSIFSGPASEEEKSKYFKDGKAEAGVNVFLLRLGGKIVLIDTGMGESAKSPGKLHAALDQLGIKPEDVDFVLLTHMHMDHIGGLLLEEKRLLPKKSITPVARVIKRLRPEEEKRAFPHAKVLVSKPELGSWLALAEKDPSNANAAQVKLVAATYGADIQSFAFGESPLPGITALDASGHTPGHTVFQLKAEGKSLLIVGDLIHSMPLQFALPDECASYDMNPSRAISARKHIFALATQEKMEIAGIHFPFANAVGTVEKDGNGWKFKRTE
ncbi:MAG: MBL fold metallo-hydrolase [Betaproteobacteria bacterium]|nr:MBL fold metallo-hydrolase [Betaproteobacteria bacterium]